MVAPASLIIYLSIYFSHVSFLSLGGRKQRTQGIQRLKCGLYLRQPDFYGSLTIMVFKKREMGGGDQILN